MIQAKNISVVCCEHGTVTIRFHDEDGNIVAFAAMGADVAIDISNDIVSVVEGYLEDQGRVIGECKGHA